MSHDPNQFEDERRAIHTLFETAWGSTTKIKWENEAWDYKDAKPYVALTIVTDGVATQASLNDNAIHRYGGTVIVQVFQKERTGTSDALKLSGKVASIFGGGAFCKADSGLLRFRTPSLLTVGPNNGWYQINVRCPYFRDKHQTRAS